MISHESSTMLDAVALEEHWSSTGTALGPAAPKLVLTQPVALDFRDFHGFY
jgi:hypothetical protein